LQVAGSSSPRFDPAISAFDAAQRSQFRDEAKANGPGETPGRLQNCHTLSHLRGKPLQPAVTLYRIDDMLVVHCYRN
jgi:hypothetical protein